MKKKIHPKYEKVKVSCACGNEFETKSTIGTAELKLEICANCHPFFTGKQKLLDTAGRIEKFNKKYSRKTQDAGTATQAPKAAKTVKASKK